MVMNHTPRVFISYSWSSEEYKEKILHLSERLRENGVDVILDQWDLKEGQDKYVFMEQCVSEKDVDKVLIMCDSQYCVKADSREGGVGTETAIITPELYGKNEQTRFIPIVCERYYDGKPCLPKYLKSRIFIDFTDEKTTEEQYEKLLRDIYEEPLNRKPDLGNKPDFAKLDKEVEFTILSKNIEEISKACDLNRPKAKGLSLQFLENYIIELNSNKLQTNKVTGEIVFDRIQTLKPIRDVYIKYLSVIVLNDLLSGDELADNIADIYNGIMTKGNNVYLDDEFEYLRFVIWELVVCTVALLFFYKRYAQIKDFVTHTYFVKEYIYRNAEIKPHSIVVFKHYFKLLDEEYKHSHGLKFYSCAANEAVKREYLPYIDRERLSFADILICLLSTIFNDNYFCWFPMTYIYNHSASSIWKKLISKRNCKNIFCLFGVNSIDELKKLLQNHRIRPNVKYSGSFDSCPDILSFIRVDDIGKME